MIREAEKMEREVSTRCDTFQEVEADEAEIDDGRSSGVACLVGAIVEMRNGVLEVAFRQEGENWVVTGVC